MKEASSELPAGARSLFSSVDFHVLEVQLKPGDGQELHEGGWRVIYSLTDYAIQWRQNDNAEQKVWSAGVVHWHEPAKHVTKNTGITQARWVVVGFKN